MKKGIISILFIFVLSVINAQENYFVTAKNGLNVRAAATLSSEILGKLPYGTILREILEKTDATLTIVDNGKAVNGNWVKVKYNNYTYLISNETEQFEKTGFVFDGYLEKLNKGKIQIDTLSVTSYQKLKSKAYKDSVKFKKITNSDSIKKILKNRVTWINNGSESIKSIKIANKQKLIINQISNDYGFDDDWSGYFPEEQILVLEGGHTSDVCFSIRTGETTETIGNPDYIISSPDNTFRLNGYFTGQECISYFFQQKVGTEYKYITKFSWNYDICEFKKFHWITNTSFIYSKMDYTKDSIKGEEKYFMGEIVLNK